MTTLLKFDPELHSLIQEESERQKYGIELIASENFTSPQVLECLGSILTNKYSEGLPGKRYYGGNEFIDKIEQMCIDRSLKAFNLNEKWAANVQAYSGSGANLAVYFALLNPGDKIMGLGLSSGGHLTHGFFTPSKKVTASSAYYESQPYKVNSLGLIDYDEVESQALQFLPKMLICGASAYSRDIDYKRFREIADKVTEKTGVKTYVHADIAHIAGFVATGLMNSPFEYCDTVMTTTHKSLRGPRSAVIFCRKELEVKINNAVFPGLQGGPHQNAIAGVACQMKEVMTPEFRDYMFRVRENAQTLAQIFMDNGYEIITGGTDNHLFLLKTNNTQKVNLTGTLVEKTLEYVNISVNKNTIPGDTSALHPSGIRIGLPAMTTRGLRKEHMQKVFEFIDRAIKIGMDIKEIFDKSQQKITLQNFFEYFDFTELKIIRNDIKKWIVENKF